MKTVNKTRFTIFFLSLLICFFTMGFSSPPAQKNYVFNLTGTIHGYGDITGPLWTLLKIKQLRPDNNYIAVVDDRAEQIISSMYGKSLELVGDGLGIQFFRFKDASHIPTADVSFELFFSGRKIHYKDNSRPFTNLIYNAPNTITVISDTMRRVKFGAAIYDYPKFHTTGRAFLQKVLTCLLFLIALF